MSTSKDDKYIHNPVKKLQIQHNSTKQTTKFFMHQTNIPKQTSIEILHQNN